VDARDAEERVVGAGIRDVCRDGLGLAKACGRIAGYVGWPAAARFRIVRCSHLET
jgi:hypothetical protein